MKSFIKSVIKILFVVILPLAFVIGTYNLVTNYEVSTLMLFLVTLLGVIIVANSVMYLVFMEKIRMFPNVSVEFIPIFGFAFGVDPNIKHRVSWLLLIPFVSFEFSIEK